MSWRRQFSKISALLSGRKPADLGDEISAHIAIEEEENVASGMSRTEAHFAAMRKFGNATAAQEASRDAWTWRWLEETLGDVKFAFRQIRTNAAVAIVSVLTLALGIGVNTAMFSVIDAAVLRPLPYQQPDRLIALFQTEAAPGMYPLTGADYLDWQSQNRTLESTSLYGWTQYTSIGGGAKPEPGMVMPTQANFFDVLGVHAALGRTFARDEDASGKNHVAVLSYGFWQKRFAGDRGAIGRTVRLDGEPYSVIGVMPKWFGFRFSADIWTPLDMSPETLGPRGNHRWNAIARMKPGLALAHARADLLAISKRIEKQYPDTNEKINSIVVPLKEMMTGYTRRALLILFGAVVLVLMIACVNVANLQLARAAARQREMAVRVSIGAGRLRLLRQLLTESLVLATAGSLLAIVAAWWCVRLIQGMETLPIPHVNTIEVNAGVLFFTAALGIAAGLLSGLAPALQLSETRFNNELKSGSRTLAGPGAGGRNVRDLLVAGEIALTLMLLIGAGLLLRSFIRMRTSDLGIDSSNLLTMRITLPDKDYPDLPARQRFSDALIAKAAVIPGVQSVAMSLEIPLEGGTNGYLKVDGAKDPYIEKQLVGWNLVTANYFATFGIPLLEGRGFTVADMQQAAITSDAVFKLWKAAKGGHFQVPANLTLVAVISKAAASLFWPNQNAVGRTFHWNDMKVTVVGVVADVKEYGIRGDGTEPRMEAYYPYPVLASWGGQAILSLKTRVDPRSLLEPVRRAVNALDSNLAVFRARPMDDVIAENVQDASLQTALLGAFAVLALVLAAVGLYGVMSYLVAQRTREIGIRVALGAQRANVIRSVLKHSAKVTAGGAIAGLAAGVALTRLMANLLYGIGPADPLTFVMVPLILAIVAMAANYLPALRATRIDPVIALRWE
ncbi:MAG: ABC transporter permease [Acidobacteriaceae bacterium]|nr:ABC transporter permease [Acidobacteriaceae bacterium]